MIIFDIREDNDRYYLKVHSHGAQQQNIDNYINQWDQVKDFKHLHEETLKGDNPNHWILVVTDKPEQNLTAKQIITTRINDKFWGLNARTPYRTFIKKRGQSDFFAWSERAHLDRDEITLEDEDRKIKEPVARFLKSYAVFITDHTGKEDKFFDLIEEKGSVSTKEDQMLLEHYDVCRNRIGGTDRVEQMIRLIEYLEGRQWMKNE